MAKLMSKKTRENVLTGIVLAAIVLFLIFIIIYPLVRVKDITSRRYSEEKPADEFSFSNDPSFFAEKGLEPDTFSVTTDDNLSLAALHFLPDSAMFDTVRGTVVLIHSMRKDRTSLGDYVRPLLDSGLAVILYDQRASGQSEGKYYSPGTYEADDLNQVLTYLKLRDQIIRPVIAVGFGIGADAAVYASQREDRIDGLVAVNPYLHSTRWITLLKQQNSLFSIPFYRTIYFWWYQKRTGFPDGRTGADDMAPIPIKSALFLPEDFLNSDEVRILRETSGELITVEPVPKDSTELFTKVLEDIYSYIK